MSEHLTSAAVIAATSGQTVDGPARRRKPAASDPVVDALAEVAAEYGLTSLANRLGDLWTWLAVDLSALESSLADVGAGQPDLGWRSARYLLARPGKRIRPVCLALAARLGDRPMDKQVREAAIACELVHAATLLHDDVVDEGHMRRGAPAARRVYGNSACVLGGDHLLVDALQHVQRSVPSMHGASLETLAEMVSAEAMQLQRRRRFDPDRAAYMTIVRGKTAALFRWALQAGGVLGGLDDAAVAALGRFGMSLGVAFQMIDDALDLDGDPSETGKSACADIREGKMTWPLLLASERCDEIAARLRVVAASDADIDADVAADLVARIAATGALTDTRSEAEAHANRAREQLLLLPQGRARDALSTIVDAALQRRK
jgi:octaprenyl-diphosphate synthase